MNKYSNTNRSVSSPFTMTTKDKAQSKDLHHENFSCQTVKTNKQVLITVLCDKLKHNTIKCKNATDDADLLIVQTALSLEVIVNGEDKDLLEPEKVEKQRVPRRERNKSSNVQETKSAKSNDESMSNSGDDTGEDSDQREVQSAEHQNISDGNKRTVHVSMSNSGDETGEESDQREVQSAEHQNISDGNKRTVSVRIFESPNRKMYLSIRKAILLQRVNCYNSKLQFQQKRTYEYYELMKICPCYKKDRVGSSRTSDEGIVIGVIGSHSHDSKRVSKVSKQKSKQSIDILYERMFDAEENTGNKRFDSEDKSDAIHQKLDVKNGAAQKILVSVITDMARHYKKYAKRNKHKRRLKNKAAMQQSKLEFMLSQARKQVVNLSHRKLTDDEYLVLSRGLKFIPSPSVKRAKPDL
ncbi:unnamed protein product [Mytilus edulis]|uniref:Uncharacterized protein n=1 Tax=Mytilus edulis TaxID=6550 RepID=A0A8S3QAU9_MYTED|nr:unnamed protein product [Mytilus edulis]